MHPVTTLRMSSCCQRVKKDTKPTLLLDGVNSWRTGLIDALVSGSDTDIKSSVPYTTLHETSLPPTIRLLKNSVSCCSLGSLGSVGFLASEAYLPLPTLEERPCETPPSGPGAFEAYEKISLCLAPTKSLPSLTRFAGEQVAS